MNILKKITISVFLLIFLFIVSGFLITRFYDKELTRYIIAEINRNLNAEIAIGEVENLSVFEKFPFASVVLNKVVVSETNISAPDTLLFAKKIYLQFNFLDILNSDYKIKRISVSTGFVRLKVDKKGNENYLIKSTYGEQQDESYLIKLSRVSFSDFEIFYVNEMNEQEYKIFCNEGILKGNFSNEKFTLNIGGDFLSHYLVMEDVEFLRERKIILKTQLDIDRSQKISFLKTGEITIDERMNFTLAGKISDRTMAQLTLKSQNLNIASALDLMPEKFRESFAYYQSNGTINFECIVNGDFNSAATPSIAATFSVEDGALQQKNTSYALEKIFLKGNFTNGKLRNPSSSAIDITDFKAQLGKGTVQGKLMLKNLNAPKIKLDANARFELENLKKFIPIDTLENISGTVNAKINYAGAFKRTEDFFTKDFQNARASGEIHFDNVNFTLKESRLQYRNFSGTFLLRNNDVLVQNFAGNISSSDFKLSGLFRNALAYIFMPQEKLTVEAAFTSTNLNLNELLSENVNKHDTSYLLAFPERVNFNMSSEIAHLSFRKFNAGNISGIVTMNGKILRSKNIFLKTMDGSVSGNFEVDASVPDAIIISSQSTVEKINIHKLFSDFENFGQHVITDRHLRGIAGAEIRFVMMIDSALNADENKIYTLADLTIENGELIGYEPMDDISGYIKNHVLLKRLIKADEFEKKLKHIKFSILKNQIEIKERKVLIPSMSIHSSAMNIEAEGMHTFDNIIDYKINFLLSELLTQKEENAQDEFGEIEEDETGKKKIFMTLKGSLDNPEISYDKKRVKKNIQQEAQKEKQTIKSVLKEEFGWFKKDSLPSVEKETKDDFMIEWEEEKIQHTAVDTAKNKNVSKEKKLKTLFDRLNKEEKKENDFEMEKPDDF